MNILKFNTMKKITTLVASLFLAIATFAQVPQGFSYQAVVRDAQNAIVANQTVEVTLTITAELNGLAVQTYTEKHNAKTNQNGLFTLVVGQGESSQKFADFKWNVPQTIYNMKTETEYGTATTQLLSVPFALYAAQAGELDYAQLAKLLSSNDIQNLLDYVKTADIDNIYKYIEDSIRQNKFYFQNYVTKEVFENYVLSGGNAESVDLTVYAKKTDIPSLNDYALKSEIPTMPAVPTKVSELQNDANYLTEHQDITGKQDVITDLADIRSGAALGATALQSHQSLEAYAKTADVDATYAKKTDLNTKANTADLATVAMSGSYNDLTNKPTIPTVPTNVSAFTNDANYLKTSDAANTYATKASLKTVATTGSYNDLTNKPTVPTATSQLTADKIGDMPMATVNVVITNVDNVATVSFLGKELTSGTTTFKIPAYSPVFLSVVLSQYQRQHENPERYYGYSYSYTVKINGIDFDPVAGYYYSAIPTGYKKAGNGKYESKGYLEYDKNHFFDYPTDWSNEEEVKSYMSEYIPRIEFLYEKTPVYKSGSGKVPENRYEPATPTDAERNMVNQVVGPFPNATNTIEIVVTRGGGGEIHN